MEYIALKDVCRINMGQSPESRSYNESGDGIPFFQGNADFGERYPVTRIWCNEPTKIANAGDILISVRAPIGALNYAREVCCIGRGLAAITPDSSKFSTEFIYWLLKGKNAELNSKGTGSTFKAIGRKVLEETMIPDYGFEQQHACAVNLEKVYAIIRMRRQELLKLDELIKARFVEMFGDPEHNNKGWPVKKLNDLCNIGSSKRIYQEEQTMEGVPFWRISDLVAKMDTGNVESNLYIPESKYEELKAQGLVPKPGDILVTSRGTLGRCYIISAEDCFYFQDGMISWLSCYVDEITPLYIQYLFEMAGFRKQIDSMQAGSTVAYLSIAMLKKLNVMLPNREAQKDFSSFVSQVDKSKAQVQKALDETQLLFDSLMQEYFG